MWMDVCMRADDMTLALRVLVTLLQQCTAESQRVDEVQCVCVCVWVGG